VANGSGVSPGGRPPQRAPGRAAQFGAVTNAIVGIDLADQKQTVAVTDHGYVED
jgi:hypothetical protein